MLTHTLLYSSGGILRLHLGATWEVARLMDSKSILKAASGHPSKLSLRRTNMTATVTPWECTVWPHEMSSSAKSVKFCFLTKAIPRPELKFLVTHYWGGNGGNKYGKKSYGPGNAYSLATFCRETSPQGDSRSWQFYVTYENTSSTF